MSGIRLTPVQLSLLEDAFKEGSVSPVSAFEREQVQILKNAGYLDSSGRLTRDGRGAYLGQSGQG